jgi:hypothetical protein
LRIRPAETDDVVFENRSGADVGVREHRKRRKPRQVSGRGRIIEKAQRIM